MTNFAEKAEEVVKRLQEYYKNEDGWTVCKKTVSIFIEKLKDKLAKLLAPAVTWLQLTKIIKKKKKKSK